MILRLGRRQFRNRGQHAERVACQKKQVGRMSAARCRFDVVDEFEWIGGTRILGQGRVVVIGDARLLVEHDVLEDAAEADGVPDLRLAAFDSLMHLA